MAWDRRFMKVTRVRGLGFACGACDSGRSVAVAGCEEGWVWPARPLVCSSWFMPGRLRGAWVGLLGPAAERRPTPLRKRSFFLDLVGPHWSFWPGERHR